MSPGLRHQSDALPDYDLALAHHELHGASSGHMRTDAYRVLLTSLGSQQPLVPTLFTDHKPNRLWRYSEPLGASLDLSARTKGGDPPKSMGPRPKLLETKLWT